MHFGHKSTNKETRLTQENHQNSEIPKKCIFKNLKKPAVFLMFLDLEATHENLNKPKKTLK